MSIVIEGLTLDEVGEGAVMTEQTLHGPATCSRSRDQECLAKAADDASALVQDLRALAQARDPLLAELALHDLTPAVALMKHLSRLRTLRVS